MNTLMFALLLSQAVPHAKPQSSDKALEQAAKQAESELMLRHRKLDRDYAPQDLRTNKQKRDDKQLDQ